MRLGPKDRLPVAAVDIEIHNAIGDVLAQMRNVGSERLDRVAYSDIVANLDIYPWPDDAEEIRQVWFLNFGKAPIPMTKIAFQEQPIVDWVGLAGSVMPFSYAQLPERRIRLCNMPQSSNENSIMWKYTPRPKRLVKATDEPNLPEPIHECIIPRAILRLAGYDGIGLAHPRTFDIYRKEMDQRLIDYLQPESIDGGDHVIDNDPYYPGGA